MLTYHLRKTAILSREGGEGYLRLLLTLLAHWLYNINVNTFKRKNILRNKRGFTLIELLATIALMAILAGIAVPSVYYSTARRQRTSAEADTQQMYRNAISCISDLSAQYLTPSNPYSRFTKYPDGFSYIPSEIKDEQHDLRTYAGYELIREAEGGSGNGWCIEYEKILVKKLYTTITALDIPIFYYYPTNTTAEALDSTCKENNQALYAHLRAPVGCSVLERSYFVSGGNKKHYFVVQVQKIVDIENSTAFNYYLVISYHNDKNPFNYTSTIAVKNVSVEGKDYNVPDTSVYNAYETNNKTGIVYSFRIK